MLGMSAQMEIPTCPVEQCPRHGSDLFVYTNGTNVSIALCYACGSIHPLGTDMGIIEMFFWNPELVMDMIGRGDLKPKNQPIRKLYKQ